MITKIELQELITNATEEMIDINSIKFNKDLYSRVDGIDQSAVVDYSQDIINIPFILINQNNYIINGVHCFHALLKKEQKQVKIKKIEIPDDDVKIAGYIVDIDTGVRHPEKDKKKLCVDYFSADPKENKALIEELKIPQTTFYRWTKDIRKERQKEINKAIVTSLLDPDKTQEMIAKDFGINEKSIRRFKETIVDIFITVIKMSTSEKQEYLKILKEQDLDFLEDYLNFEPYLYNIWNQKEGNKTEHFGSFPMNYMRSFLYYHTKPFDVVFDPFAGDGTTVDACAFMYRKHFCSDLIPVGHRKEDIRQHDINAGLPKDLKKCDIAFLDPPYWTQAEGKYSNLDEDFGNMSLKDFNNSMQKLIEALMKKKVERVAIVIMPTSYKNKFDFVDHTIDFHEMFKGKYGVEMRYILPYSSQQYNAQMVNKAKEAQKCLVLNRDLTIWRIK